jgi:hypothetical protein
VTGGDLGSAIAAHLASLAEARLVPAGAWREVRAHGSLAAVVGPGVLEVRLRPAIAAAALRTPDVTASPRGAGWVRFAPAAFDDFARDRAVAWLESAVRLAEEVEPEA